jgi:hypothetical protein
VATTPDGFNTGEGYLEIGEGDGETRTVGGRSCTSSSSCIRGEFARSSDIGGRCLTCGASAVGGSGTRLLGQEIRTSVVGAWAAGRICESSSPERARVHGSGPGGGAPEGVDAAGGGVN